jgi:hypothetical protein
METRKIKPNISHIFQHATCSKLKGKGKDPVLFLTEHNAIKAYWENGGIAPLIL